MNTAINLSEHLRYTNPERSELLYQEASWALTTILERNRREADAGTQD